MTTGPGRSSDTRGNALPIALFFSLTTGIIVLSYMQSQYSLSRPFLRSAAQLQARLTARSGIWHGLGILNTQSHQPPPSRSLDTTADPFTLGLFAAEQVAAPPPPLSLVPNQPLELTPFVGGDCGTSILELSSAGLLRRLKSRSAFRGIKVETAALLGSRPFSNPDTVLFLRNPHRPQGAGSFHGTQALIPIATDSLSSIRRTRFSVYPPALREYIDELSTPLGTLLDTAFESEPLTVSHTDNLSSVPDVVEGALVLDATFHSITWKSDRTIHILGDLQIDGDVLIDGLHLIVGGEIRLGVGESGNDKIRLKNVELFSRSRAFFGKNVVFDGSALALGEVEIYRNAKIVNRSVIATRASSARKTAPSPGSPPNAKPPSPFTLHVREDAVVDGALLCLDAGGGIRTEPQTLLRGVLWSEGRICHEGRMEGVVKARILVSGEDPMGEERNRMDGTVRELYQIGEYRLPYFVGELSIVEWFE